MTKNAVVDSGIIESSGSSMSGRVVYIESELYHGGALNLRMVEKKGNLKDRKLDRAHTQAELSILKQFIAVLFYLITMQDSVIHLNRLYQNITKIICTLAWQQMNATNNFYTLNLSLDSGYGC